MGHVHLAMKQALQLLCFSCSHHWDPTTKTENWGCIRGDGCQRGLGNTWREVWQREVVARKDDNRSKDKNTPGGKDALRTLRLKKDQSRRKRQTVYLHLLLLFLIMPCFKELRQRSGQGEDFLA